MKKIAFLTGLVLHFATAAIAGSQPNTLTATEDGLNRSYHTPSDQGYIGAYKNFFMKQHAAVPKEATDDQKAFIAYGSFLNKDERAAQYDNNNTALFLRLADEIVVISDNEVNKHNPKLIDSIDSQGWEEHMKGKEAFRDLKFKGLDLDIRSAQCNFDGTTVPFAVDLLFTENHPLGLKIDQGTYIVTGELTVIHSNQNENDEAKVQIFVSYYSISQRAVQTLRDLGFIDEYDINFVRGVTIPVLEQYLSNEKSTNIIFNAIGSSYQAPLP